MKKYKYRAIDIKDEVHVGEIKAVDHEHFLSQIYALRLYPLEVTVNGATEDKIDHLRKLQNKLSPKVINKFELNDRVKKPKISIVIDWYYVTLAVVSAIIVGSAYVGS